MRIHSLPGPLALVLTVALASGPVAGETQLDPFDVFDFTNSLFAERASVFDNETGETLWKVSPPFGPETAAMGSTAKIMTIHVALRAVEDGDVSLGDYLMISNKAGGQACNCFGPDPDTLDGGEWMTLDDALYSVGASDGEPTVAVAEFIAKAVNHGSLLPAADDEEAAALEQEFIALMNDRVAELGLSATTHFETVHGGDAAGQHTTTDDLITIWNAAVAQDTRFLDYTGYTEHTTTIYALDLPPGGVDYTITKGGYGYHPGVEADKGGDSTECVDCMVSQATRAGRTLVAAVTQAQDNAKWNDTDYTFERGYELVFEPDLRVTSAPNYQPVDHSLACLTADRAASAVVTPSGNLDVFLWDVDVSDRDLEAMLSGGVKRPGFGFQMKPDPQLPPLRRPFSARLPREPEPYETTFKNEGTGIGDPHPDPNGLGFKARGGGGGRPNPWSGATKVSNEGETVFVAVDSAYAGSGNLVVAAELTQSLRLYTYGLPLVGDPFLRDWVPVGEGSDLRVVKLTAELFATAHRAPDGALVMQSWSIDPATGSLSGPLDVETGPTVQDVEIAGRGQVILWAQVVAGLRLANDDFQVRSWSVNVSNGVFESKGVDTGGAVNAIDIARVRGFGHDDVYAVAVAGVNSASLKVIAYDMTAGDVQRRGDSQGTGFAIGGLGQVEIASFDHRGVLVAHKSNEAGPTQVLTAWSIDNAAETATPNLLAEADATKGKLTGMCRVPDADAEGDFLVGELGFFDQRLRLAAWRSGAR